jgi:hypothetical protein
VHLQSASLDVCGKPGQCGDGFVEVGCNGPNDCEMNEVCCGRYSQTTGYQLVECTTNCGNSGGTVGIVMCGDDPGTCGPQEQCYQSGFLPTGHGYCQ